MSVSAATDASYEEAEPFGVEGIGSPFRARDSLPHSGERIVLLDWIGTSTTHDLFINLVTQTGQMFGPVLASLGLVPAPMIVTRDYRVQLHPDLLTGSGRMVPGVGDKVWGRMHLLEVRGAYFRLEIEFRVIAETDERTRAERDLTGGRANWGRGEERRPGLPFAGGWIGFMMVVRDPKTHRLRSADAAAFDAEDWHRRGIIRPSILARDPGYAWLLSGIDGDADIPAEAPRAADGWEALPPFEWRSRWTDNDSFGHTNVSRRPLPFLELSRALIPTHRVAGIYFECKTEILPGVSSPVSAIWNPAEGRARFVLDNGKPNRAGAWLVEKGRMRLKTAGGGPA
ncbi:hypothetical protein DFJ74DRAFT_648480 [Hyaloraphidium curvatum]|nr:hypothetical protein DFJ74DRAFT_648480 [Hyaloraphidium curvatum]